MESFWSWLVTAPAVDGVLDPFAVIYACLFGAGFVAAAYMVGPGADRISRDPTRIADARHWSQIGLCMFGTGLFFFGVRALQINPLSFGAPIWMVASSVALIVIAGRWLRWRRAGQPEHPHERCRPLS